MAYRYLGFLAGLFLSAPALAYQSDIFGQRIEDFEGYMPGTATIEFLDEFGLPSLGVLSGGAVTGATDAFPAISGAQVYKGQSLVFTIDQVGISWPGVGAFITGASDISVIAYALDPFTALFYEVDSILVPGGAYFDYAQVTGDISRVAFSSATPFAIDDLTLGVPGIAGGIPEPASWALLIAGFGMTGTVLRRKRTAAA